MMEQHKIITFIILLSASHAKMMRNSALITKMVSNFHQNNELSDPIEETDSILIRMQIVLCNNFPSIPCKLITEDKTLKKLIEKSIQQISHKKLSLDNTSPSPEVPNLFPTLNNDDLSKFIQLSGVLNKAEKQKHDKKKRITKLVNRKLNARAMSKKSHDVHKKIIKKSTSVYNRKKLRKFYPHIVKYGNNNNGNTKGDIGVKTPEKFSMSVEVPDMPLTRQHEHFSYKMEPENSPVWRIDYSKHGEPSVNTFDFDGNRVNRKIPKTGSNVIVRVDNDGETRKNLIYPDFTIKNNFVKSNSVNSDVD
ncbi:uncharacterized protein LOC112047777 [Bicyclus anynana]|uniref:Uncharacterized protein LOC112047777 n=1 Tax=Bicyclus anynana TaxID=110368 RepID=A0A6J1MYZ2_BICAN|nr:uncharacterized protein LOC112047777 [Bicyclus anynana]